MKWFGGESWDAPVCDSDRVDVPVGQPCIRCGELFEADDQGLLLPTCAYHKLCLLGSVVPIVVHRLRGGFAVCGFSCEVPGRWPPWHFWSRRRSQVNCPGCNARIGVA